MEDTMDDLMEDEEQGPPPKPPPRWSEHPLNFLPPETSPPIQDTRDLAFAEYVNTLKNDRQGPSMQPGQDSSMPPYAGLDLADQIIAEWDNEQAPPLDPDLIDPLSSLEEDFGFGIPDRAPPAPIAGAMADFLDMPQTTPGSYCTHDILRPEDVFDDERLASVQEVGHRRALLHRFACVMFLIGLESDNPPGPQVDPPMFARCRPSEMETQGVQLLPGVAERIRDCAVANSLKESAMALTRRHVLNRIPEELDEVIKILRERFMEYHQDQVPALWRDGYADAHVMKAFWKLRTVPPELPPNEEAMAYIVSHLDKSLIVAGPSAGTFGEGWIEGAIEILQEWEEVEASHITDPVEAAVASTRQALEAMAIGETSSEEPVRPPDDTFSQAEPFGRPQLSAKHVIPRHAGWSLANFEYFMRRLGNPRPRIFTDQMQDWPALTSRRWASRAYFLSLTFNGRRLVPVEIGRTYVDDGWGQELMPFGDFLQRYIDPPSRADQDPTTIGYVAQHDLFRQIPKLRNDILIPDLCWAEVPGHPVDPSQDKPLLDMPQMNAWFGPARTITPLHTDGYHNLLCQVVGKKYVRMYPPWIDKEAIRPKGMEDGIDMSNTSELDLGVIEGWDEPPEDLDQIEIGAMRDDLKGVEYWECILEEGETLLIPMGWWHYVRSLSVSFSVSFWWN